MHTSIELPMLVLNFPGGQELQYALPLKSWNFPEGQGEQICALGSLANLPAMQLVYIDIPEYGHAVPGGQFVHTEAPGDGAYLPAWHSTHALSLQAPVVLELFPLPQGVHSN